MDYTAFGFAGLCLLVSLVCAVIAAHRGGTMRFKLPFITFDGEGLALTRAVRALFVLLAFTVLGIAVVWILAVGVPEDSGTSEASGTPTATATVTVPVEQSGQDGGRQTDGNGTNDNETADGGTAPDGETGGELVEAWSGCEFELHYGTVLSVGDKGCPSVTEESADITMDYDIRDGDYVASLEVDSAAYVAAWNNKKAPSPAQCRDEVEAGGVRGGTIWIDNESEGEGVCLRTSSGDRYVYLRLEEVVIESSELYAIAGTGSAWDAP